jgi:flavodoxin
LRKIFKIILAIFAVLIIGFAMFGAIIFLDLAAYTAGGSQTLAPSATSIGIALVVYNPGLSGAAKGVAERVANELQAKGFTVTLAGVKSSAAENVAEAKIIVVGGPVYAGTLATSINDYLNKLIPNASARVGVFGSGSGAQEDIDIANIRSGAAALSEGGTLANAVVVKIGTGENVTSRVADFLTQLTGP